MLKLMKYEFRKARTTLMALGIALIALELWFLYGARTGSDEALIASTTLLAWLTIAVYACLLIAAIVSYSRELRDRTGYLTFMMPVRPIEVVVSKLLFAALSAIAVTALFGAVAWADLRALIRRAGVGALEVQQANLLLQMLGDGTAVTLADIGRLALYMGIEALAQMLSTMCAAFLAITLSATLLENRRGFLRGLLSFLLFLLLTTLVGELSGGVGEALRSAPAYADAHALAVQLLISLAACALYAWLSAYLLDRKVSL